MPAEAMRQLWLSPPPNIHWGPHSARYLHVNFQVCLALISSKSGLEGLLGIFHKQGHRSLASVFFDEWKSQLFCEMALRQVRSCGAEWSVSGMSTVTQLCSPLSTSSDW